MPVEKQIVMTRPDWDTATSYGSFWIGKAKISLIDRGMTITDLAGELARKSEVVGAFSIVDPIAFWGMGHGNEMQFAGQDNYLILEKGVDEALMIGRVVHLTSCLTGVVNGLLQSLADAGALACIGYKVSFIVGVITPNIPDRPDNIATESLMKPDIVMEYTLANGKTCGDALIASDIVSEIEIEYWRQSGHPDADLLITSLISNRNGLAFYGDPQIIINPIAPPINVASMLSVWLGFFGIGLAVFYGTQKEVYAYGKA